MRACLYRHSVLDLLDNAHNAIDFEAVDPIISREVCPQQTRSRRRAPGGGGIAEAALKVKRGGGAVSTYITAATSWKHSHKART